MTDLSIDVHAEPPFGWAAASGRDPAWPSGSGFTAVGGWRFFVPAGRVEEIYGNERWPLGS